MRDKRQALAGWLTMALAALLAGCASQAPQVETPPQPVEEPPAIMAQPLVAVQVAEENLRATPNGVKLGTAALGESFPLQIRRGNWVRISHPEHDGAWIWAPSLGYEQVNPAAVPLWLGDARPQVVDSLVAVFGDPMDVDVVGGDVFWYRYDNRLPEGGSAYGTSSFRSVRVLIDRGSRAVLEMRMELGPFEGSVKDLLAQVGLPDRSSTKTNFERALFVREFPGIDELEMHFAEGDFNRIERLRARRFPAGDFADDLVTGTKKLVPEDGQLTLSMEVTNMGTRAYAAPTVALELYLNEAAIGAYELGPLDVRLEPGETETVTAPLPVPADRHDLNTIAARAEITGAVAVPSGG